MKTTTLLTIILLTSAAATPAAEIPQSAAAIQPLLVGDSVPQLTLRTPDGAPFDLRAAINKKPTVLVFYRGGWCPYCSRHLAQLQTIEQQLLDRGFQIFAVSPDRPAKLAETAEKDNLSYLLLSDSSMEASRAFGIAFRLDDATFKKYKEQYGIDIEVDSGHTHHQLPVPAVFITDTAGQIVFVHFNPDYKTRLDPEAVMRAAEAARLKGETP